MRALLVLVTLLLVAACGAPIRPSPTPTPWLAAQEQPTLAATTIPTRQLSAPSAAAPASNPTRPPTPTSTPPATATATATAAPTATPTTAVLPSPSPTPTPAQGPIPIAIVRQNANLRSGPGAGYALIGEIRAGQEVFVLARNPAGDWIQLDLEGPGQTWIAAFLLDLPRGLALPVAADIPPVPPTPTPGDLVSLQETTITLPTYPWRAFTVPAYDEATGWEYLRLNRSAYEASNPLPSPQSYRLVVMENRWLRLTFLPDLGGRLYQMIFKPTGSNQLYQNPVIKPSPWGPGEQGNGWLAVGGIEWGLPVIEHGYAWGEPWGYITAALPPAASITVFDRGQDRVRLSVDVGLQPDSAAFTLDFLLENPNGRPVAVSYWTNAMLAPGPANRVGPDLRFYPPADLARVHSTGEADLPAEGEVFTWPVYNGRDVSRLGTWQRWLGAFAHPQAQAGWAAVYDAAADEGVVRIFPPQHAPGLKIFGLGWAAPIDPAHYTDDGSSYVELHGGITPTFWDAATLRPGAARTWREIWYPVAGLGGVSWANAQGAAYLNREPDGLRLRLYSVASRAGEIVVSDPGGVLLRASLTLTPATPADLRLPASAGPISFQFRPSSGPAWSMSGLQPDS